MSKQSQLEQLKKNLESYLGGKISQITEHVGELTLEVASKDWIETCQILRDEDDLNFEQLTDLCGVDYLEYGRSDWITEEASGSGFGRAVSGNQEVVDGEWSKERFAVVIHLISYTNNWRLRVRTFVDDEALVIPSVTPIWNGASWFEREAFDLYGILFEGHEDLRRILTDYGFVGHPFRKDFPLIGNVEMRYDAAQKRCVYEPVSIEPRILVPRVIREDQRFDQDNVSE